MLSSISPFGERARNSRWGLTVVAYLIGSIAGGALTGVAAGWAGELLGRALSAQVALVALALGAVVGILAETGAAGLRVPSLVRRQVNEDWLTTYRGWVYGFGFGLQLGTGLATIVATATVWLVLLSALLVGTWWAGLVIGAVFGTTRGLAILATRRIDEPSELRELFRSISAGAPSVHRLATVSIALTALTAGAAVLS